MTISPTKAANLILAEAARDGVPLTPLQVMKLVYIAHGMHLGLQGAPLVGEHVQAWQYGPVLPSLYHRMKEYRNGPVRSPLPLTLFDRTEPSEKELETLASVYRAFGKYSGPALSNLTHRPGSPWSQVWRPGVSHLAIPNELIRRHYKEAFGKGVLEAA